MNSRRVLVWGLLVLASGFFLYRGPVRGMATDGYNDFAGSYTIAHLWIHGLNCYSPKEFVYQWVKDGRPKWQFVLEGAKADSLGGSGTGLPPSLPFLAPFTVLPTIVSDRVWIWLNAIAIAAMLLLLFQSRSLPFLALALALATLHTGIKGGNCSILVIACLGFSYLWRHERPIVAGVLLGIAGCFKPHLAGAGLLFLISEQTWIPVMLSALTGLASFAIFALRMAFTPVGLSWLSLFTARSVTIGYAGGADDFSLTNPSRYQLVNLQVILGTVLSNSPLVNAIAISIVVALVILWCYWMLLREVSPIVGFAAINVILLLPSYHRIYDAGVVVFAIAAIASLRYGWTVAVALTPFIAPIPSAIMYLVATGRLPSSLLQNKGFVLLVLCHQIWILFGLALFLVVMMSKSPARTVPSKNNRNSEGVDITGETSPAAAHEVV
jgi:hypothetical protein